MVGDGDAFQGLGFGGAEGVQVRIKVTRLQVDRTACA